MKQLNRLLLFATAFFIPSNLSFHFLEETAVVNGLVIDYLTPKIYLSDLAILSLLVLNFPYLLKKGKSLPKKQLVFVATIFALLLFRLLFTDYPIPGIYSWLKLLEFFLFGWLLYLRLPISIKPLAKGLGAALIFQSLLAAFQFFSQQSLLGYMFLGEPNLTLTHQVAKSTFFEAVRLLPYGTTPHPNVLAGFATTSAIILISFLPSLIKKEQNNITAIVLLCLTTFVVFITESLGSVFGMLSITLIFIRLTLRNKTKKSFYFPLKLFSSLIFILIVGLIIYHSNRFADISSITRRYKLLLTSKELILAHPLLGTGLNQYIPQSSQINLIADPAPFYQPVHSIYPLLVAEVGLPGFLLWVWFLYMVLKTISRGGIKPHHLPLLNLLFIGLLDHYPLTLQPGQLLLALSLAIFFKDNQ